MTDFCPRFMIAAVKSGEGKTTVALSLLAALKKLEKDPICFKSGPDYIDPMFHKKAVGIDGANLDLFLSDEETVNNIVGEYSKGHGVALIEGAMGFYDGAAMTERASCYHLAKATGTPVILAVSARGAALTIAAVIKGLAEFREDSNIKGVILNRCSKNLFERLAPMIEQNCGVQVLGYLPENAEFKIESRHLGLVTADEIADIKQKIAVLGDTALQTIDFKKLLDIAGGCKQFESKVFNNKERKETVIAVAKDEAFCFYYDETLSLFKKLGAEIIEFSPLRDKTLPEKATALYLGGGYPELFAKDLSENNSMLCSIKKSLQNKMPCIAECGGFLYLHDSLADADGADYPMVGIIKGGCARGNGLKQFGYVTLTAHADNILCKKGETMAAHEFHYWQSETAGGCFTAQKPDGRSWDCVHANEHIYAGFPHLYLAGNVKAAEKFIAAAERYGEENGIE